ncbi:hypothetical protein ABIA69_001295 [Lysinibacillus parviboronicapiens]|jgi:hypothetical protein|uniref:DUF1648 domain-containing protein n=1 Tax=Lysinibacillus parviboronicapiens TaxID=436516 RepID=A0ABV2PH90_9BACI
MTKRKIKDYFNQSFFNNNMQQYMIICAFILALVALWFVPAEISIHFNSLNYTDIKVTKYIGFFPIFMTITYLVRHIHWRTYLLLYFLCILHLILIWLAL